MTESLRTTQIAFFRFATPCGFFRGAQMRYKKYPCKAPCKRNSYETICENIVSRYQTLVSSLPRETTFRHRRQKAHFMTGPHRQPSNEARPPPKEKLTPQNLQLLFLERLHCVFVPFYKFLWESRCRHPVAKIS